MKKEVYRHLLRTYGRLPLLWIGIITKIIETLLHRVVIVLIAAQITLSVIAQNPIAAKRQILLLIIIYAIGAIVGVTGELIAIRAADNKYVDLLVKFHGKLIGKDMAFYRNHQTGYLTSLFRQHLDGTIAIVRLFRGDIVRMVISILLPIVVLFIANWKLGYFVICIVGIESLYVMWSSNQANKYRKPAQEVYRKLTGEVADELTNAIVFKSSGREAESRDLVYRLAREEMQMFWLRHKTAILLDFPRILFAGLGLGMSFGVVLATTSGTVSVGLLILTLFFVLQIMNNVAELPDLALRHDEHIAKVYPTLEYLGNGHETVLDPAQPKPLKITRGKIKISNISFGYKFQRSPGEATSVFSNLSLSIEGGEHIGIVGLSGAGKSTLMGLLMRFDDVDKGSISIDGVDIRDVRQSELRQKIAYVPQEPLLFHRSVKENIAYFNKEATDEEIFKAAEAVNAHEFIVKLSDKYETLVGERGTKLSGGQRQRIVMARAILKNAPILIFDEATSALDSENEQVIQSSLPRIIGKHTTLIIAHRLSTVAHLDRIIVMHGGTILEKGTHEELLALEGHYYSLWQRQSGGHYEI